MRRSRTLALTLLVPAVIAVAAASSAWACTNLATLNLSATSVQPGNTVTVTGSSFSMTGDEFAKTGAQPVELRWDAPDGPVLASATADKAGFISASVVIPTTAKPGEHVLVATQVVQTEKGPKPAYGTPARAALFVGTSAAPGAAPAGAATAGAADAGGSGTSAWLVGLTALLGVTGLALLGAGLSAAARSRRAAPEAAPVNRN